MISNDIFQWVMNITSPEKLEHLSNNNKWEIRWAVARNRNTPIEIIDKLSTDDDYSVNREVTFNINTPNYIKCYLQYKTL